MEIKINQTKVKEWNVIVHKKKIKSRLTLWFRFIQRKCDMMLFAISLMLLQASPHTMTRKTCCGCLSVWIVLLHIYTSHHTWNTFHDDSLLEDVPFVLARVYIVWATNIYLYYMCILNGEARLGIIVRWSGFWFVRCGFWGWFDYCRIGFLFKARWIDVVRTW